ncbi:OLC1v1034099C1 [Oldenlandia corymbosa var. corymbosa]|uniref:OLC1v1034099C1 n=1 Tax=Oldenlandia corymbosa var. corymbosa TaxID=529605 RepID=A0AAV1CR52_OLDCO|nr:OLC1v1034099C1 [Oldenlandia corymbosa var. corymbosa]
MSSKVHRAEELDGGFDLGQLDGENRRVGSETVTIIEAQSIQVDKLLIEKLGTGTRRGIENGFSGGGGRLFRNGREDKGRRRGRRLSGVAGVFRAGEGGVFGGVKWGGGGGGGGGGEMESFLHFGTTANYMVGMWRVTDCKS